MVVRKSGTIDIGGAGEMRAQHHDHRRWLREIVEHFESDTELHSKCPFGWMSARNGYETMDYIGARPDLRVRGAVCAL